MAAPTTWCDHVTLVGQEGKDRRREHSLIGGYTPAGRA